MRLNPPQLITAIVVAVAALVLGGFILTDVLGDDDSSSNADDAAKGNNSKSASLIVRENSHVLDEGKDDKAVLVEFLDFECEACGSVYPVIEELRKQYDGDLTYIVRYFPGEGHQNSRTAAYAAEAAARQDKFEDMYSRLFTTQAEWGESSDSKANLFRSYAEELGLNMTQYDKDVKSKSVADRVQADFDDAMELNLRGTPSFFFNGEKLEPQTVEDIISPIEEALGK